MSKQEQSKGLFDLKGEFVSERLSNDLRQQIESGALKFGEVLKPVRELMKQYGISYNSVRKALNQLSQEGFLTLEQGRGTFVKGAKVPRRDQPLNVPIKEVIEREPISDSKFEELSSVTTSLEKGVASPAPSQAAADEVFDPSFEDTESEEIEPRSEVPETGSGAELGVFVAPDIVLGRGGGLGGALDRFLSEALRSGRAARLIPVEPGGLGMRVEAFAGRGVVVWGVPVHERDVEALGRRGGGCVLVGYWPARGEVSGVMPDNFGGAYELARRVASRGHREVAFLGTRRAHGGSGDAVAVGSDARERLSGCRVAWEEAGIELARSHIIGATPADDWLADRLLTLKPRPTAVVVSEQVLAEALIGQLKERGIGVPRALSVACFGAKGEPNPVDITSMRVDWDRAGRVAWTRLRELLAGAPPERLRIGLPVEYHEGGTVADLRSPI